jgi:DNA-binding XRE family transcriptional regulator
MAITVWDRVMNEDRTLDEKHELARKATNYREMREAWVATQMDVARYTGLSLFSIYKIETVGIEAVNPRLDTIRRLACAVNLSPGEMVDQLLGEEARKLPWRVGKRGTRGDR